MGCIVCHDGVTRLGTTAVTFCTGGQTVVVNEVPADVCENCAEAYVDEATTEQLLEIGAAARGYRVRVLVRNFKPVG